MKSVRQIYKELIDYGDNLSYKSTISNINENFNTVNTKYKTEISNVNKLKRVEYCE